MANDHSNNFINNKTKYTRHHRCYQIETHKQVDEKCVQWEKGRDDTILIFGGFVQVHGGGGGLDDDAKVGKKEEEFGLVKVEEGGDEGAQKEYSDHKIT
jgi:hypothetical protein